VLARWVSLCFLLLLAKEAVAEATFANGVSQGTVSFPELKEASGVVASRNNLDVLWTHNDSGDLARIYALDTRGRKLGNYYLPGATNVDWEDIAIGPGPVTNVSYIYVGDIGDNNANRSSIQIYQIPEPGVYARQYTNPAVANLKGIRQVTLHYPDGPHNAEALFVDPWNGDLFIATKHSVTSGVYTVTKSQFESGNNLPLSFVTSVDFDVVSGADISPTGTEIVFRQEDFARLWTRLPGQTISSALASTPVSIPVIGRPTEPNGEAIGFDAAGVGYYTLSDSSTNQPLYYFRRTSGDGPKPPQIVLPAGAVWKYLDNGSDPGTEWFKPGYDDRTWLTGAAQFGYGNGDEVTVLGYGPDASSKFVTTFFRTEFVLGNAPCISNLVAKLVVTDGAAVYVNGVPAMYYHSAPGAPYDALAIAVQPQSLEDSWLTFPIDAGLLLNGTNILAVEVRLATRTRPNLRFDAQLLAYQSMVPRIISAGFAVGEFQLSFCGPSDSNLNVQASADLTNWGSLGSVTLTNGIGVFYDSQATSFDSRFYRVQR